MASKCNEINTINPSDSREVQKNVSVQRSIGITVRNAENIANQNNKEADENDYSKPGSKPKTASRSPLTVIPEQRKPAFAVYHDEGDEYIQDAYDSKTHQIIVVESRPESVSTDFSSSWDEVSIDSSHTSDFALAEAAPSKIAAPDEALDPEKGERCCRSTDDDDYDLFCPVVNNESSIFRTEQQSLEQLHFPAEPISCHPDYEKDIYLYMREREQRIRPSANYLRKQTDISYEMRYILIEWIADVSTEYNLSLECLHLAASIVDRTLSLLPCPKLQLQLVGTTALMIATKFEEIFPPELDEFVGLTDKTYSAVQILHMERVILSTLHFDVSAPTSNWFGARVARKAQCDKQRGFLMDYLLELSLLDYRYIRYRPSLLACAALCLANVMTGVFSWPTALELDTGVTFQQMVEPMRKLLLSFKEAPRAEHKAVYEKYAAAKYCSVACLRPPTCIPTR